MDIKIIRKHPNFVVVGAPKAGTTSLYEYLKQHPQIFLPQQKELHFFTYDLIRKNCEGPGDKKSLESLCPSRKKYLQNYINIQNEEAIGEISPSYLYYSNVRHNIHKQLGNIKIIILLRKPSDRAYSNYMHLLRDGREKLDFLSALMQEKNRKKKRWGDFWRYTEHSLYFEKVKSYLDTFGKKNVHVVIFESFVKEIENHLKEIFSFLNIDTKVKIKTTDIYNKSGPSRSIFLSRIITANFPYKRVIKRILPKKVYIQPKQFLFNLNLKSKPKIENKVIHYLEDIFAHDINKLESLLDADLSFWVNKQVNVKKK